MCQEDQIALLKGSCTEMMILRSAVSYDPDRDSWNVSLIKPYSRITSENILIWIPNNNWRKCSVSRSGFRRKIGDL